MTIKQILFTTLIIGTSNIQSNIPKPIKFTINLNDEKIFDKLTKTLPISKETKIAINNASEKNPYDFNVAKIPCDQLLLNNSELLAKRFSESADIKNLPCIYCASFGHIILNTDDENDCHKLLAAILMVENGKLEESNEQLYEQNKNLCEILNNLKK